MRDILEPKGFKLEKWGWDLYHGDTNWRIG
jgi:hypothetical protein